MFLSLQKSRKYPHSLQRILNSSHNSVLCFVCQFRTVTDPKTSSAGGMLRKHSLVCHWLKAWHWTIPTTTLTSNVPWILWVNLGRWAEHWTKSAYGPSAVAVQGYSKLDYEIFLKPEFSFHFKLSPIFNVLPLLSKKWAIDPHITSKVFQKRDKNTSIRKKISKLY